MTSEGSFTVLQRYSADNKTVQSKSVPKWRLIVNLRVDVSYLFTGPENAHPCRNDDFCRILRKNPFKGVGCSLIEEPPKRRKAYHKKKDGKIAYLGNRNP